MCGTLACPRAAGMLLLPPALCAVPWPQRKTRLNQRQSQLCMCLKFTSFPIGDIKTVELSANEAETFVSLLLSCPAFVTRWVSFLESVQGSLKLFHKCRLSPSNVIIT